MRCALCVVLVVLTFAGQPRDASTAEKPAEALIKEGLRLRRAGRDLEALDRLQRAYTLEPSPRAAAQVGLCLQAVGRWSDADQKLGEALSSPEDAWIQKNKDVLRESIEIVKTHVGRVEITGSPEGTQVLIGGKPVGRLPLPMPVALDEGPVDIEGKADGFAPVLRSVTVFGGQYQKVVLRLNPELPPATNSQAALDDATVLTLGPGAVAAEEVPGFYRRPWFWGVAGSAVLGAIIAGVVLSGGERTETSPILVDQRETF